MWFDPQIKVDPPDVLNPNGCILDGVMKLYDTAFDIKAFGLSAYLANKLIDDLKEKFGVSRVKIDGKMDVDPKAVQTEAFWKQTARRPRRLHGKVLSKPRSEGLHRAEQ